MVRQQSMTYFAEKRVNGKSRRVLIGKHPLWSAEKARNDAMVILASMAQGNDPAKTRDITKTVSLTVAEAFAEFLASKEFRPNTLLSHKRVMNQPLADWQSKPITSITRGMVDERFKELSQGSKTGTSGKANANITMKTLRAVLNYASLKYEVDGEPLLPSNPVTRLTQARAWHRIPQRQGVIPDHKLASWAKAVSNLGNPTARDYYMVLLFTGLRKNQAAQIEWRDVDFDTKALTIRAELNKGLHEFRLPLSTFLFDLFSRRHAQKNGSEYVFPSYRRKGRYYGSAVTVQKLRQESGCEFITHDIRRTTLTMAERLGVPHYALKKLAGHSMREDITAGYLVIDVERLREPMQQVCDRFVELMGLKSAALIEADCLQAN